MRPPQCAGGPARRIVVYKFCTRYYNGMFTLYPKHDQSFHYRDIILDGGYFGYVDADSKGVLVTPVTLAARQAPFYLARRRLSYRSKRSKEYLERVCRAVVNKPAGAPRSEAPNTRQKVKGPPTTVISVRVRVDRAEAIRAAIDYVVEEMNV